MHKDQEIGANEGKLPRYATEGRISAFFHVAHSAECDISAEMSTLRVRKTGRRRRGSAEQCRGGGGGLVLGQTEGLVYPAQRAASPEGPSNAPVSRSLSPCYLIQRAAQPDHLHAPPSVAFGLVAAAPIGASRYPRRVGGAFVEIQAVGLSADDAISGAVKPDAALSDDGDVGGGRRL